MGLKRKRSQYTYIDVIVAVVVKVEDAQQLAILGVDVDILCILDAFSQGLPGIFLHLDVVELPVQVGEEHRMAIKLIAR